MFDLIDRNIGEFTVIFIVTLLLSFLLCVSYVSKSHIQAMADKGYVEVAQMGSSTTLWVKGE